MGLHHKSRDYLFREFVKRNYRDSKGTVQKALLSIRPDEIAAMKEGIETQAARILDLLAHLRETFTTRKAAETGALELLRRTSGGNRGALYLFSDKNLARLRTGVGSIRALPKTVSVDPDLLPPFSSDAQAVLPIPPDSPLAHDLRRQRLLGSAAVIARKRKPSALVFWNQTGAQADATPLLILEILALHRGDRALPPEPVKAAPRKAKSARKTQTKKKPAKAKKRILPEGILETSVATPPTQAGAPPEAPDAT